jgi:hypothetical protein
VRAPRTRSHPTLYDRTGPDYTQSELRALLGLSPAADTLWRLRRSGGGPPFRRLGRKHARVTYPRAKFWQWYDGFVFESEADAEASGCR